MLAAVPLIKGWPPFELRSSKGGALSDKIKIVFLRGAAAPSGKIGIPLYKRGGLSHIKLTFPLPEGQPHLE
jgi:hypothetical protein